MQETALQKDEDYRYSEEERSYYALNVAVTADNYQRFYRFNKDLRQGFKKA